MGLPWILLQSPNGFCNNQARHPRPTSLCIVSKLPSNVAIIRMYCKHCRSRLKLIQINKDDCFQKGFPAMLCPICDYPPED